MEKANRTTIKVFTEIALPIDKVWELWIKPEHIINWNFASDDWHCPAVKNDLRAGGKFSWRMEAKDGSMGFDFSGIYQKIITNEKIVKELDDGRKVEVSFSNYDDSTKLIETFEPEEQNSLELQKNGWQAILDNFKAYALSKN